MYRNIQPKKPAFRIETVVVSPITQIEPSGGEKDLSTKASMIKTKTRKVYNAESNRFDNIPFFSANALRSMSRAVITEDIFNHFNVKRKENGNEKRFGYEVTDFQAYTAGGGSSADNISKTMTYATESGMRALSPFLSLFGIGLGGIEGKSVYTSLIPSGDSIQIGTSYGVRMDKTKNGALALLIDEQSVLDYMEEQDENRKNNKDFRKANDAVEALKKAISSARKNGEDTGKLELELHSANEKLNEETKGDIAYQQMYKYEYIVPGTIMTACTDAKAGYELTDVEEGMMFAALLNIANRQIGALKAIGHGLLNWKVLDKNGEMVLSVTSNKDYILERDVVISAAGQKMLDTYVQWLEAQTENCYTVKQLFDAAEQTWRESLSADGKAKGKKEKPNLLD